MSTPYTGQAFPLVTQDSTTPNPGTVVSLNLPVDADPSNAATLFTQQYETLADHGTALTTTLNARPPVTPSAITGSYGAVTHVGAGTGTVTFNAGAAASGLGQNSSNKGTGRVVVKIIVGGAVATATFQLSLDSGNTYGSTQATAAQVQDASGVVIQFTGTFAATDLYIAAPADVNQIALLDPGGNIRSGFNHNGSPIVGRCIVRQEAWLGQASGAIAAPWVTSVVGGGSAAQGLITSVMPTAFAQLSVGSNADKVNLYNSAWGIHCQYTALAYEIEFALKVPSNSTNTKFFAGICNAPDMTGAHPLGVYFQLTSGGNWLCVADDGTTQNTFDTGFAPSGTAYDTFRIELYGSTAYGATNRARFFAFDKYITTLTANMPGGNNGILPHFAMLATAAPTNATMGVTPFRDCVNLFSGSKAI